MESLVTKMGNEIFKKKKEKNEILLRTNPIFRILCSIMDEKAMLKVCFPSNYE